MQDPREQQGRFLLLTVQNNAKWFEREDAFRYLDVDDDNRERVRIVLAGLSERRGARQRLLDLGCGDGRVSARIAELGYDVTGLDASADNVGRTEARGVRGVVADVEGELPFEDEIFDVVYAGEIIEHVFDTSALLSEVRRVLRPAGLLVVTTPNLVHLPDRLRFVLGRAPVQTQPLHRFLRLHIRPFAPDTLRAALQAAGFDQERLQSTMVVFARDPRDEDRVLVRSKLLARAFPHAGSTLVSWATRR